MEVLLIFYQPLINKKDEEMERAIKALALLTSLNPLLIEQAYQATANYRIIKVRKKSGGYRKIYIPPDELKFVQQAILECLYLWPTHDYMYGFQPGRSPVQNARMHLRLKKSGDGFLTKAPEYTLKLDLKDAFPSVKQDLLERTFRDLLGYWQLSSIKPQNDHQARTLELCQKIERSEIRNSFIELLVALTSTEGCLPQGTPSAPYLLNLALVESGLVRKLTWIAKKGRGRITFYADDITMSANSTPTKENRIGNVWTQRLVDAIEETDCFRVNHQKTHVNQLKDKAHIITGVSVHDDKNGIGRVSIRQKHLREIRRVLWLSAKIINSGEIPNHDDHGISLHQALGHAAWVRNVYGSDEVSSIVRKPLLDFDEAFDKIRKRKEKSDDTPQESPARTSLRMSIELGERLRRIRAQKESD